jgi:hypothetical protein
MPDTDLLRGYVRFAITAHHGYLRCILRSGRARPSAPRGEGSVSDQPPWDPWQTQGQQCPPLQPYGQPPYARQPYPQGQPHYGLWVLANTRDSRPAKGSQRVGQRPGDEQEC